MDVPSTRPTGRKPTSRTSRNSFTDRSEVKMLPARPGSSSARRRMASCGTPAAPSSSETFWSVIRLLLRSSDSYTRGLPALRVQGQYGEGRLPLVIRPHGETGDRGADDRRFHDVVAPPFLHGAFALADAQLHVGDHDALGA